MLTAFEYLTIISASMLLGILLFSAMISARRSLLEEPASSAEEFSLAGVSKSIRLMTRALAIFVSGFVATLMLPTFILDSAWFLGYQWGILVMALVTLVRAFLNFGLHQSQDQITEDTSSGSSKTSDSEAESAVV
jgi:SNF family Na+-dependent transporter